MRADPAGYAPAVPPAPSVSGVNGNGHRPATRPAPADAAPGPEDALLDALGEALLARSAGVEGALDAFWRGLPSGGGGSAGEAEMPLLRLCRAYRLAPFERDLLAFLLVFQGSARFREACAHAGLFPPGGGSGPKAGPLLAALCADPHERVERRRHLAASSPLVREGLVDVDLPGGGAESGDILEATLRIPGRVLRLLLGDPNIYSGEIPAILRERPAVSWEAAVFPEKLKTDVAGVIDHLPAFRTAFGKLADAGMAGFVSPVILLRGPSGTGKTLLAKAIAARLGRELLSLDLDACQKKGGFESALRQLYREARLSDGVVFLDECHRLLEPDSDHARSTLIEIERSGCLTILATTYEELEPAIERRAILKVLIEFPESPERARILSAIVAASGIALDAEVDLEEAAWLYPMTGGDLQNLLSLAALEAVRKTPGVHPPRIGWKELDAAADLVYAGNLNPFWRYGSPMREKEKPPCPAWLEPARRLVRGYIEARGGCWSSNRNTWMKRDGMAILVRGCRPVDHDPFTLFVRSMGLPWASTTVEQICLFDTPRKMFANKGKLTMDDLFVSPNLTHRLCFLFDPGDLAADLSASLAQSSATGRILELILQYRGIAFLNTTATKISPQVAAKFDLVLDHPEIREASSLEVWEGFAKEGWPAEPGTATSCAGLPIAAHRRRDVAHRAWTGWLARGGKGSGRGIAAEDVERAWKELGREADADTLFGNVGTRPA